MNWKSIWSWLLLIWVAGIAAYSNTLFAPFVFDDLVEIVGNAPLRDFDVPALLQRYPTRIVTYITLAANHGISGLNVESYHVVNILIHLFTATVIFFLVSQLAEMTQQHKDAYLIAGITTLVFVSHPIQTQAVTYIIQRLASLTTLFYLTGTLLYVMARKGPSTSLPPVRGAGRVNSWNWLRGAAWLAILLAMFSKEIALTAPIAILLIEWFFFSPSESSGSPILSHSQAVSVRPAADRTLSRLAAVKEGTLTDHAGGASENRSNETRFARSSEKNLRVRRWWQTTPYLILLLVIPLTLWFGRPPLVERDNPLIENAVVQPGRPLTVETESISRREYLLTQVNVVRTYLRLLVLPTSQNLDYDYPISHSLFKARTLGSALLLLSVIGLGVWLYPRNRLASFGIFFFFLALLVESSFVPIRDVIYEHRLYLPSLGIFLSISAIAVPIIPKRAVLASALAVTLVLAGMTLARNAVWGSEVRLWNDVVQKSPLKARGYNNLGVAYVKNNEEAKAAEHFERAIEIEPRYAEAYNNLGLLKAQQGDYGAALDLFIRAVELEPLYVHAFNNMGVIYLKQGKADEAIYPLEMAAGTDDSYLDAKINLAVAYMQLHKYTEARAQVEEVLSLDPAHQNARELEARLDVVSE